MHIGYLYLSIAIVAEVIATSALKASDGFTKSGPSLVVVLGYGVSFYFLSLVLKQPLDAPALLGIGLIVAGVAVIQLFSRSTAH